MHEDTAATMTGEDDEPSSERALTGEVDTTHAVSPRASCSIPHPPGEGIVREDMFRERTVCDALHKEIRSARKV